MAALTAVRSRMSARTSSNSEATSDRRWREPRESLSRQRTLAPEDRSLRTSAEPMNPVPPVTRTFLPRRSTRLTRDDVPDVDERLATEVKRSVRRMRNANDEEVALGEH